MLIVDFKDENYKRVTGLWQWDYGQVLRIQGLNLPKAVEIHFSLQESGGQSVTRIGMTKDGVTDVVIPDSLLENEESLGDYDIFAFIYLTDDTSGQTEYKICMPVKARPKPEAFDKPEDEEIFREAITAVRESAERAEKSEQQAAEHAEQTKADAQKTTADRQEVEKLVESVSGISEQVETVKGYAEQTQTAATNASLSERASEQAKESALQAQANAETAEGMAEQHALEVAGDKSEVERLATQVRRDKSSVEQTVQGFGNTAQQAIQSVNTAKTQAVNAINTAEAEAIKAVADKGAEQTGNVTAEGENQVQAVQAKGQEVINSIPEDFPTQMATKLDKQQGTENAGKALVIGDDGNVVAGEPTQQIEVDKTLTQERQAADAKATGDKILQYAIKNTASGEGIVKITDSADEKLQDFKLFGKSEQLSTTGKNLFDISKFPFEHDAEMIVIKPSEGQTSTDKGINITEDIKFEENTQYVISYDSYNVTQANENWTTIFTFYYTDGAYRDLYVNHFYGNLKKYFNSDSGKTIRNVAVRNPRKVGIEISKVQIEKGNVATDYEPYTGGKPSPSIEYQQEIVNAGESGQIEVQVTGKNLLEGLEFGSIDNQGNIIQSTTAYVNINKFIEVKEGKHVINSRDGKRFLCAIFLYDKDKQFIRLDQSGDCVVRKGEKYINITSAKSLVDGVDKTQIELADKSINPTAYKPYKGLQKVQFQLDEPLRGIGDYRDTITKDGIVRKVKEDVLNGSEYWVDMTKETFKKVKRFGLVTNDITYNTIPKANLSLCDKFPIGDINTEEVGHVLYSNRICFMVDKEQFADLEVWKAWLSQNPVTVQYALKEPIVEPLPTEIKELFTYYPITVISNDQNCGIEVEYVADTKLYTDNKIAENVASIISQYQTNVANLLSLMPLSVQAGMVENDTNNILENVEEMKHE